MIIAVVLVAVLVAGGVVAAVLLIGRSSSSPRSAGTTATASASATATASPTAIPADKLTPEAGTQIFHDDFSDPSSGWYTGTLASGTVIQYGNNGYTIDGKGGSSGDQGIFHFARAPLTDSPDAIGIWVRAVQSHGTADINGFGLRCDHGQDTEPAYYLRIYADGSFNVSRSDDPNTAAVTISQGTSTLTVGGNAVEIHAACITLSSGGANVNRLVLEVNGHTLADIKDTQKASSATGWSSGVTTETDASDPSTVTFSSFAVRNLRG